MWPCSPCQSDPLEKEHGRLVVERGLGPDLTTMHRCFIRKPHPQC